MRNTSSTSPEFFAESELPAGFEPAELDAGLLAATIPYLAARGLDHPPLDPVLEKLGVSRARADEAKAAILELLPSVLPPPEVRLPALIGEVVA